MESKTDRTIHLLTIPAIARTGLLPVSTLRAMDRARQLPSIRVPINEKMIRAMLAQAGRKPSEKQVREIMRSMNAAK